MKLRIKLSRSLSTSPASSTPPSPRRLSTSSLPPPTSSPKKLRFLLPHLGSNISRTQDDSTEIVKASSPTPPSSSRLRAHEKGKAFSMSPSQSARHNSSPSPSQSARHSRAKALSDTAMHEIKQVFAQFDANGDGKISAEELRAVLTSLGDETTSEEAALMVHEVDADGDGYIDLKEFVDLNTQCLQDAAAEEEMAAAFAIFDLDKNGHITAEELQEVLSRLGGATSTTHHISSIEDCKQMIRGVDRKGTGHVDFDDFKRMMTPLTF